MTAEEDVHAWVWCSVSWLQTGLHPDGYNEILRCHGESHECAREPLSAPRRHHPLTPMLKPSGRSRS